MSTNLVFQYKFKVLELIIYVLYGTLLALYIPGITNEERPLIFVFSGSLLGLIMFINNIALSTLRVKLGLLPAYTILGSAYTLLFLIVNLADSRADANFIVTIGNSILLGLLVPIVLLGLSMPMIIIKKIYKTVTRKIGTKNLMEKKEKSKQYKPSKNTKKSKKAN